MKTAEQWNLHENPPIGCQCGTCERTRLIQLDAFAAGQAKGREDGMREAAKLIEKGGVECLTYNEDCLVDTIKQNILSAIERKQP